MEYVLSCLAKFGIHIWNSHHHAFLQSFNNAYCHNKFDHLIKNHELGLTFTQISNTTLQTLVKNPNHNANGDNFLNK